jgi:hypothetical protein
MPSFLVQGNSFFPAYAGSVAVATTPLVPTSGNTIHMTTNSLFLQPAGTLAALIIYLPNSPVSGQTATITSTAAVTSVTWFTGNGGAIVNVPAGLTANTEVRMRYTGTPLAWNWIR